TAQAFDELRADQRQCPAGFVPHAVQGEPPLKYHFNPPPDANWSATPGVDRFAVDATVTDQQGQSTHEIAVYLRRGRVLVALYLYRIDLPGFAFGGQVTAQGIAGVIASRIAQLPAAVVS